MLDKAEILIETQHILRAGSAGQEIRLFNNLLEFLRDVAIYKNNRLETKQMFILAEAVGAAIISNAKRFGRTDIVWDIANSESLTIRQYIALVFELAEDIIIEIIRYLSAYFDAKNYMTRLLVMWDYDPFWRGGKPRLEQLK